MLLKASREIGVAYMYFYNGAGAPPMQKSLVRGSLIDLASNRAYNASLPPIYTSSSSP